jgi:hypothetical protein
MGAAVLLTRDDVMAAPILSFPNHHAHEGPDESMIRLGAAWIRPDADLSAMMAKATN